MEKYSWNFYGDAEEWRNDPYNTITKCISVAREAEPAEEEPRKYVYVGENVPFIPTVDAYTVLEQIGENAYEFCESAEDWYPQDAGQEELDELSGHLTEVVQTWLKKYHREPYFWQVQNIKRYPLEGEK